MFRRVRFHRVPVRITLDCRVGDTVAVFADLKQQVRSMLCSGETLSCIAARDGVRGRFAAAMEIGT